MCGALVKSPDGLTDSSPGGSASDEHKHSKQDQKHDDEGVEDPCRVRVHSTEAENGQCNCDHQEHDRPCDEKRGFCVNRHLPETMLHPCTVDAERGCVPLIRGAAMFSSFP